MAISTNEVITNGQQYSQDKQASAADGTQVPKAETPPANGKTTFSLFDSPLGKWLVFRLSAVLLWYWAVLKALGLQPVHRLPSHRKYLLIPFLVFFLVLLARGRWFRASTFLWYVVGFPIIGPMLVIWRSRGLLKRLIFAPINILRAIVSSRTISLLIVTVAGGWTVVAFSSDTKVVAIASLTAHAAAYVLFLQTFRWASNPYRPLVALGTFISGKGLDFLNKNSVEPALKDESKRKQAIQTCDVYLTIIGWVCRAEMPIRKGLVGVMQRKLVPFFIVAFLSVYAGLACSFSVTLYEMTKAWGPLFRGLPNPPSLLSFFYFSFLSQATTLPNEVQPISAGGQLWLIWIVMTGLLLLTAVVTTFTTSVGSLAGISLDEATKLAEDSTAKVSAWKDRLSGVIQVEAISVVDEGQPTG